VSGHDEHGVDEWLTSSFLHVFEELVNLIERQEEAVPEISLFSVG